MQLSQIPTLVPQPFAANGDKNTIPQSSQIGIAPGAASLNDGFPPLTFTPLAAGGIPPSGADFNGILNLLSANINWSNAGGFYQYDQSFSSFIGGYPKTAILAKASGQGFWLNLEDNNTSDPDTGGAGWISFDPWAIQAASYISAKDTGAVNAYAVALTPSPSALTPGMLVNILQIANTNTGAATLAVNGLSTLPVLLAQGTALIGGELLAGYGALVRLNYAGTAWELIWTGAGSFVPPATQSNAAVNLSQLQQYGGGNFQGFGGDLSSNTTLPDTAWGYAYQLSAGSKTITMPTTNGQTGQAILNGGIASVPREYAGESPCTYCHFQSLCRFDAATGYAPELLDQVDEKELFGPEEEHCGE